MLSTPHGLSRQRREELRNAFRAFDSKGTGLLDLNEMLYLLKSIGVSLSATDTKAITSEYGERGGFDYEDLLTIAQVVYNDVAIERSLVLALRRIAPKGSKKVNAKVLREYLLNLGLKFRLTEAQVDMFLNICCEPDARGEIDIGTFIYRVLRD